MTGVPIARVEQSVVFTNVLVNQATMEVEIQEGAGVSILMYCWVLLDVMIHAVFTLCAFITVEWCARATKADD